MPVPRCGSPITRTSSSTSSRPTSESSGVAIESPVTSSVCSWRFGAGGAPIRAGSKASAVTGDTAASPPVTAAVAVNESRASSLESGDSQAVAS